MRVPPPLAIVVGALLLGVGVPYAVWRDRPAKEAFEYVAPEGFIEAPPDVRRKLTQGSTTPDSAGTDLIAHPDRKAWYAPALAGAQTTNVPRIVLVHSERAQRLSEDVLARVASDMVEHQRAQGLVFAPVSRTIVTREDGARVGIVAWDVETAPESPQPAAPSRRTVQLTFPENEGMAIVTATFAAQDVTKLQPLIEESARRAHGVATQAELPAVWIRVGLLVLGAALGWVLTRRRDRD